MTHTEQVIIWAYVAIIAIWPLRHFVLWLFERKLDFLTQRSPRFDAPNPPLVTAIIPAKDEELTLSECLESVCAQSYPNLEVLVVDDRSTDATASIAREFAARDPRVRLMSITELPAGWTGKTHALHSAAAAAQGDWFWFIDSDTRHTRDSLSIMMEYARSHRASMASLLPGLLCETFWEKVVQPLLGIVLMQSFPPPFVNRSSSRVAFANGQYILIERTAYEAAGGHYAVRDRFVEDIYMAKCVKATGRKIHLAMGREISSVRMYTSLPQLVRGWSRILYDALGRRPIPLVIAVLDPLIFSQTAHVALVCALVMLVVGVPGPFPIWLLGLSVVHHLFNASVLARVYRMSTPTARGVLWYPLAGLVLDWILFRAIAMCLTGRVTWRGTSYGPAAGRDAAPAGRRSSPVAADDQVHLMIQPCPSLNLKL
ncbi:MAG TPA: glycosyltransferase family 2 protein [Isosphaeraceae bacterium]|jgi:glycosyltransferase involved in cell wall biosynthesis|nr:glycosyltransferase family 2 protein [Isosphaeraceae bacterium]